jgi:hypothetical protein
MKGRKTTPAEHAKEGRKNAFALAKLGGASDRQAKVAAGMRADSKPPESKEDSAARIKEYVSKAAALSGMSKLAGANFVIGGLIDTAMNAVSDSARVQALSLLGKSSAGGFILSDLPGDSDPNQESKIIQAIPAMRKFGMSEKDIQNALNRVGQGHLYESAGATSTSQDTSTEQGSQCEYDDLV